MAPAQVTAADIREFDVHGQILGDGAPVYVERFIHAALYRARPDIAAIVHSHAHTLVPFGATEQSLRPIWHMAGFIPDHVPVFEIRRFGGEETNMLISDNALGDRLADVLGDSSIVLMRGHGATVVGESVQQAVFRAIYAQLNAGIQLAAMQLGSVTYLNAAEAAHADDNNSGQVMRAWNMWVEELPGGADRNG